MRFLLLLLFLTLGFSEPDSLWTKTYGAPNLNYAVGSIIEVSDSNFIISGSKYDNNNYKKPFLLKINPDGQILWQYIYNDFHKYLFVIFYFLYIQMYFSNLILLLDMEP